MKKLIPISILFALASCGVSAGSAPVQPSFVMQTTITRTSPEAKGMVISVQPAEDRKP